MLYINIIYFYSTWNVPEKLVMKSCEFCYLLNKHWKNYIIILNFIDTPSGDVKPPSGGVKPPSQIKKKNNQHLHVLHKIK